MRSPRRTTANGTLDERVYYCQNWRQDVVALLDSAGGQLEMVRYSAYGVPFGLPAGDCDSDGDTDGVDVGTVTSWNASSTYDVRGDVDLDGDVDSADVTAVGTLSGTTVGHGALSRSDVASHAGYASYRHDESIDRLCHVRYRVLHTELGHWSRRNPLGYVEGPSLVQYSFSDPLGHVDPTGLPPCPYGPACAGGDLPADSILSAHDVLGGIIFGGNWCLNLDSDLAGCPDGLLPNDLCEHPGILEISRKLKAECGCQPTIQCRSDEDDPHCKNNPHTCAYTPIQLGCPTIVICSDSFLEGRCHDPNVTNTLYHELIHALQLCRYGDDVLRVWLENGSVPCHEAICMEFQAYYLSDPQCANESDNTQRRLCACASTALNGGVHVACAGMTAQALMQRCMDLDCPTLL